MANNFKNYGLGFLTDEKYSDTFEKLIGYTIQEGKTRVGYSGVLYTYKNIGDFELWVTGILNLPEKEVRIESIDTHCSSFCVWDMTYTGMDLTTRAEEGFKGVWMVEPKSGNGGMLPVEIIDADILPGLCKGDSFKAQIIAQPLSINYYASEDEYVEAQPADEDGKRWVIANGSLCTTHFLNNHWSDRSEGEHERKNDVEFESDRYIRFAATVTKLWGGRQEIDGEKVVAFIRCFADTNYGELEFDHTFDQVPEEQRENIKVGSVISGICILSGDVAIYEYDDGYIKDFDHDLQLMRYTFEGGDPERLRHVLSKSIVYESEATGEIFAGIDEVLNKFHRVRKKCKEERHGFLATIIEAEKTEFPAGTRCIALAYGEETNIESLMFISVNDDGLIERIKVSTDPGYRFRTDVQEETQKQE